MNRCGLYILCASGDNRDSVAFVKVQIVSHIAGANLWTLSVQQYSDRVAELCVKCMNRLNNL